MLEVKLIRTSMVKIQNGHSLGIITVYGFMNDFVTGKKEISLRR